MECIVMFPYQQWLCELRYTHIASFIVNWVSNKAKLLPLIISFWKTGIVQYNPAIMTSVYATPRSKRQICCSTRGADKSLARPTSHCHRTESTVLLERGLRSCAELNVFSRYTGWKEACHATREISTTWILITTLSYSVITKFSYKTQKYSVPGISYNRVRLYNNNNNNNNNNVFLLFTVTFF